tara:strand:- start:173 stop:943 length:771 start_codon:yes stop_codon:yes gene_type:complete
MTYNILLMKNTEKSYSIILPTFNEVGHIKKLILEIYEIFESKNLLFEIIIADDYSTDGTIDIIKDLEKRNKNIFSIIRKNKKKSLVSSINDGINFSKYENIIWMDADYSHPPIYLKNFTDENIENYDVVVFSRFLNNSERYFKNKKIKPKIIDKLSIYLNKICRYFLFKSFTDYSSGYICIKKSVLKDYKLKGYYGDYFIRLIVHCYNNKAKIIELPYVELDRQTGDSKTTQNKLDFIIKCSNYLYAILESFIKKK